MPNLNKGCDSELNKGQWLLISSVWAFTEYKPETQTIPLLRGEVLYLLLLCNTFIQHTVDALIDFMKMFLRAAEYNWHSTLSPLILVHLTVRPFNQIFTTINSLRISEFLPIWYRQFYEQRTAYREVIIVLMLSFTA